MKILAAAAAFIFLRSATAENISGSRKLSDETQEQYTVQASSYAGQSVIGCDTDGISPVALSSLVSDHHVIKSGKGFLDILVRSTDERAEVEAIVGSACEYLYDMEEAMSSFENELVTSRQEEDWFASYHTFDEIVQWYQDLHEEYPSLTTFVPSIGTTHEGRDIPAFHVTAGGENTRKVWIQCQLHAREWVSAPTCMYIVHNLVTMFETDEATKDVLKHVELIVIPIANPDGYVYTWTSYRLWRKNKSPNSNGCYGTDLNRNYNDHWDTGIGSSNYPCDYTYKGTAPASELETKATTEYFIKNAPIFGAIDIHAYSQLILSPLGWARTNAPDHAVFVELMDKMEEAIEGVYDTPYTSQRAVDLYPTSATSVDWFYGEDVRNANGGVRAYALAFELRDAGVYKFELPADQIRPNCEEIMPSIIIFMNTVVNAPLSYVNECVDTKLTFTRRPTATVQKSCEWIATSQKKIDKFCSKVKYFDDFSRRQSVCSKCCNVCSKSNCNCSTSGLC